jgi:prevent-host-death family protein
MASVGLYQMGFLASGRNLGRKQGVIDSKTTFVHIVHMKEISIRDLHLKTGEWIRRVSSERRIVVSERGVPVATLIPFEPAHKAMPFANRKVVRGFEELPAIEHDSTEYISSDRDRA